MPKPLRPPVKIHGGKHYLASRIIELFPEHETYVEPFGGAASVLLNKPPAPVEVYNDMDARLTRLFWVLREKGDEFRRLLSLTPYSEVEFEDAVEQSYDPVEQARRDFVRWRQSIGGRRDAFSYTLHRVRRGMADVVSGYLSMIDEQLPSIIERLRTVQIVNRPAVDVIKAWDSPTTLVYADPPYVFETRDANTRDVYGHEMTDADHRELAETLKACESKVILSGYPSGLYEELYQGWRTVAIEIANHSSKRKTKSRKQEVLWLNW